MVRIMPRLIEDAAVPPLPTPPGWDSVEMFRNWDFKDPWNDACLEEVYIYLRGNLFLDLPSEWRGPGLF